MLPRSSLSIKWLWRRGATPEALPHDRNWLWWAGRRGQRVPRVRPARSETEPHCSRLSATRRGTPLPNRAAPSSERRARQSAPRKRGEERARRWERLRMRAATHKVRSHGQASEPRDGRPQARARHSARERAGRCWDRPPWALSRSGVVAGGGALRLGPHVDRIGNRRTEEGKGNVIVLSDTNDQPVRGLQPQPINNRWPVILSG